jgi:4-hydroxy-4-methyl-2-oxoglutarate aldolase
MKNVVVTGCPPADLGEVGALARFGVATVHEAIGRTGVQYVDHRSYQEAGP